MRPALKVFGALADESRLRLLFALRHGELCVCQLIAMLGLSPSTVSKHLSILRDAGLLDSRKQGRWVYYRIAENKDFPIIGSDAPALLQSLEKTPIIKEDARRLKDICRENMDDLCRRLLRSS